MTASPQDIDVLIIGAGINGAGLFRDLCEQGLRVVIVDKADFGSGTSAAPSRLIHGGIKYLETGEFRLVAQSTLERNLLLRNAPHCVTPLPTVIPIFSWLKGIPAALRTLAGSTTAPRSRGAVLMKIGLALYDFYGARQRVMPRHALWSKKRALGEIAPLTPRIVAAGTYFDAKVSHPERLVLELLQDGIKASPGSQAINYAELLGADGTTVRYRKPDGVELALKPRIVVNAAGPWIDRVNEALGAPSKLIGGTKGSHILLDHPDLIRALNGRMIYFEADDGRICLVFDYLGRALVGSTDIRDSDPDTVRCEDDEIDYFLQSLRSLLPGLSFDRSQIVYAYSGIRPLPASDAANPGLISRDHSAPVAEAEGARSWPIISLVGGKWTTFRGFAEEVAEIVLKRLDKPRRTSTAKLAIGGGHGFPEDSATRARWIEETARKTGAAPERAEALLDRYGTTARSILAHEAKQLVVPLADAPDFTLAELDWIARNEAVVHLEDIVMRRTALAITGRLSHRDLGRIADVVASALGWDAARREVELKATQATLTERHRLRQQ
ncbi:glycerol-3-phosphate dehydrogenase/oxidase [Pseudaminobacter sp. 19-2017]|uniref:Glycerol-3-phosphate dehydrogenase/oxidase n=1 Tax=Pseudaminobacter soli (ex Zhang et al. 2022) TaxID=2831468 RepID=A0A942DVT3_9HYPH|nr:glycerol-3-phosphate dehydrogenase/oxidase [Pseudaminobacter soli]MBS3647791.1 glycerol-3-phosphate dehydrogenase/oxidase [Pseudaminobacter soli]